MKVKTGMVVRIIKRLSPWIVICFIPYCLSMAGVVTWKNQNPNHLTHLWDIIVNALDSNKVIEGLHLALDEFIFNFGSIGAWIKFVLFIAVPIVLLKITITLIPHFPSMFKAILFIERTTSNFLRNIKRSIKKINVFGIIECSLRYHLVPDYSNNHSIICLSTSIDGMKFLGGVKADNVKFPKIHLISYTGAETDHFLDKPILIVQTSSGVFLCGQGLIDENDTIQKKIKLSREIQSVTIGIYTYRIYIEER